MGQRSRQGRRETASQVAGGCGDFARLPLFTSSRTPTPHPTPPHLEVSGDLLHAAHQRVEARQVEGGQGEALARRLPGRARRLRCETGGVLPQAGGAECELECWARTTSPATVGGGRNTHAKGRAGAPTATSCRPPARRRRRPARRTASAGPPPRRQAAPWRRRAPRRRRCSMGAGERSTEQARVGAVFEDGQQWTWGGAVLRCAVPLRCTAGSSRVKQDNRGALLDALDLGDRGGKALDRRHLAVLGHLLTHSSNG